MAPDPNKILGPREPKPLRNSVTSQFWSAPRLKSMRPEERAAVRKEFVRQSLEAESAEDRANGASLVRLVDMVDAAETSSVMFSDNGPRGNVPKGMQRTGDRPLADRVADMKAALGKTPDADERQRRWAVAVDLCGSPAEAKRRGYRDPNDS